MEKGAIKIPSGYYKEEVKKVYGDWQKALGREALQNAIDSGAKNCSISFDKTERTITVEDDGCGMSKKTILDVFLALGESYKPLENSTGAFGEAKKLILLAHKKYEIHTQCWLVCGADSDYTISEQDWLDGTLIKIWVQDDEDFPTIQSKFTRVVGEMETDCAITIDGVVAVCDYPKGELRKTLDIGSIYINEDLKPSGYAKVRIGGIWMFDWYIGSDIPAVTLELGHNSIDCLTSNRDSLKYGHSDDASKFFHRLAADRQSALHPDKEEITLRTQGEDGEQIHVSDEDMEFMDARFNTATNQEFLSAFAKFVVMNNGDLDEKLSKLRVEGTDRYDYQRLRYFGFRWDTVHKFEKGKEEQAKMFLDGSRMNAQRAKTLLTMWGESVKQVMLDTKIYKSFTIGFNWNDNQQAQLGNANNELHFFLNPKVLDEYPLTSKKKLARKLKMLAMHEVSHINRKYHDEYFMEEMERITEMSWKSDKMYDRLAKIKG